MSDQEQKQLETASIFYSLGRIQSLYPEIVNRIWREHQRVGGVIPYEPGYVYAIQACGTNFYKLGKTADPDRRLLQISPKMPFETRYVKVWQTNFMNLAERHLHETYARCRKNGEWFELDEMDVRVLFDPLFSGIASVLRNAYALYFFESVIGMNDFLDDLYKDFLWSDNKADYFYAWAKAIGWIDHLFGRISETVLCVDSDFKRSCDWGVSDA